MGYCIFFLKSTKMWVFSKQKCQLLSFRKQRAYYFEIKSSLIKNRIILIYKTKTWKAF
jgi:hypothetical protein